MGRAGHDPVRRTAVHQSDETNKQDLEGSKSQKCKSKVREDMTEAGESSPRIGGTVGHKKTSGLILSSIERRTHARTALIRRYVYFDWNHLHLFALAAYCVRTLHYTDPELMSPPSRVRHFATVRHNVLVGLVYPDLVQLRAVLALELSHQAVPHERRNVLRRAAFRG